MNKMKKIAVTGATGMIGAALVRYALSKGIEVLCITRKNSGRLNNLPKSDLMKIEYCDIDQYGSLALDVNYDVFYHFAWDKTSNFYRDDVDTQTANIRYTLDALLLAKRMGCKKFIGAGSQAEYGRVSGTISSDMGVAPDSAYGVAKYAAGRLSAILAEQLDIEHIWTRIFSTYGINDMDSTMISYCIRSLLNKEMPKLTRCEQIWDYLYCDDAAKAFYLLGENGKNRKVYNIGSGIAKSLKEYVETIRNAIDPNLPLGIGEREYAPMQVMHLCADISELQKDTGFQPYTSFENGIKKTVEWYRTRLQT